MRFFALQLPYAAGVAGDIQEIPADHERIAGWDKLEVWLDPSFILNPSPWQALERVSDRSFGIGSGAAPTETTINDEPAFGIGTTAQVSGAFNLFTAGKTIVFVAQFNALVAATLMRLPGGQLSLATAGTRPSYVPNSGTTQSMPVNTVTAINTPYLFMWAFDDTNPAAVLIRAKVGTVEWVSTTIGAPTVNSISFNPFGSINARIGDVMLFDDNLFSSENAVLKRDVLDYFNTKWNCAI